MGRPRSATRPDDDPTRVERLVRRSLYGLASLEPFFLSVWLFSHRPAGLALLTRFALTGLCTIHTALCILLLHRGLAHYLGKGPRPGRLCVALLAMTSASAAVTLLLRARHHLGEASGAAYVAAGAFVFCAGPLLIALSVRRAVSYFLMTIVGVSIWSVGWGLDSGQLTTFVLTSLIAATAFGLDSRLSAWRLSVMRELDAARYMQAQVAIMQERLRIARDLHDVMGRNLAAIALKSELAIALTRRQRVEALDHLQELHLIAHEAHKEVRQLVQGYRTTDIRAEIDGARSLLRAAGIDCAVQVDLTREYSMDVQTVLGWVIRESTTNVLRHSNAKYCEMALRVASRQVTLEVVNDRVREVNGDSESSGLTGLRERLAEIGGVLSAGVEPDGRYRLLATVPTGA